MAGQEIPTTSFDTFSDDDRYAERKVGEPANRYTASTVETHQRTRETTHNGSELCGRQRSAVPNGQGHRAERNLSSSENTKARSLWERAFVLNREESYRLIEPIAA